jgi:hypothetical protein
MALLELPVRSDLPSYDFLVSLQQTTYKFRFKFNARLNRWIMSISDELGDPVLAGVPVLTNLSLLRQYNQEELPPGLIYALDTNGVGDNASVDILFGDQVKLLYDEAAL